MKQILIFLIPVMTLAIITTSVIYLSRRFSFYFNLESPRKLYILFGFITTFMIVGLIAFTNTTSPMISALYILAALLIGIMLYLLLSTLLVDLIGLFSQISPRYMGISSLILTLLITVYGIIHAGQIKTTEMDIQMAGLKKDVKIVHLSDLHIGHFRGVKWMQKIADITKAQQPDIVCITGDLFDGKIRLNKNVIAPLKQLEAPIYFVEGNHDGYTDIKKIKQNLKKEGIRVLSNQIANTHGLQIVGLNHMLADEDAVDIHAKHKTMKEVLEIMPIYPEMPTILLHHSPDGIEYANKAGVNLFLAGHTHAGQLFPINCIANMIFAYNRGLHQYKDTQIYVSEGIGTFGPPMRIGTRSEIVVLNLKKDDKVTSTSHY